eukprot:g13968.t1
MQNLVTISAASNKRHFYVNGASDKLVLRYVKLVGGDVSSYSYPDNYGGSILIYRNGGELQMYFCIVSGNKGYYGGGILAEGTSSIKVKVNIEGSILEKNDCSRFGGAMNIWRGTVTVTSTTFTSNTAKWDAGAMYIGYVTATVTSTNFTSNTAGSDGGGLQRDGGAMHIWRGTVTVTTNSFKSSFEEIEKDVTQDLQIIQTGLGATTIQQNNDLLEQSKVIMGLDEKMDEALDLLRKKSSQEKAREEISHTIDENEIDKDDVDFYDFTDLIGKGGQGEVFRVRQGRFTRVAKVVSLRGLTEERRRKLYDGVRKELVTMCRCLNCENIVRVFGLVKNIPDKLVLIMEYATEGSLRNFLDKAENPLSKELVFNLIYDVANGMKYIYSKGVEHRDLKADNVLLDEQHGELVAKVCDFGLAKCEALITHTASMSKGTSGGTLAWKAPEEFDDEPFNEKCDVYSFGVVMWEIMTTNIPWEGLGVTKIMMKVARGKRPDFDEKQFVTLTPSVCRSGEDVARK